MKATEMVEKKNLFGLSWKENMQMKAHTAMCKICKEYEKQSKIIDLALKNHFINSNVLPINNKELKLKIISKLE